MPYASRALSFRWIVACSFLVCATPSVAHAFDPAFAERMTEALQRKVEAKMAASLELWTPSADAIAWAPQPVSPAAPDFESTRTGIRSGSKAPTPVDSGPTPQLQCRSVAQRLECVVRPQGRNIR